MSELTFDEIDHLVMSGGPGPDRDMVMGAFESILVARRPRIEAEALRRVAAKVKAQERAALQRGLIALADRYRVTFSCLRDEADRLDPREA